MFLAVLFLKSVALAVKGEYVGKELVTEIWAPALILSLMGFRQSVFTLAPCERGGQKDEDCQWVQFCSTV